MPTKNIQTSPEPNDGDHNSTSEICELRRENARLIEELGRLRHDIASLRESGQISELIIHSVHEGIVAFGVDMRYQVWNRFMEELTGISASQVLGKHPDELFSFLKKEGVTEHWARALNGDPSDSVEFKFTIGERSRWVLDTSFPLRDDQGQIVGALATVQEVTARGNAQSRSCIERPPFWRPRSIPQPWAIIVVDQQGGKILQNQRAIELLKIPSDIANQTDDEEQLRHVMRSTKDSAKFIEKVNYLYSHPEVGQPGRDRVARRQSIGSVFGPGIGTRWNLLRQAVDVSGHHRA